MDPQVGDYVSGPTIEELFKLKKEHLDRASSRNSNSRCCRFWQQQAAMSRWLVAKMNSRKSNQLSLLVGCYKSTIILKFQQSANTNTLHVSQ